MICRTNPTIVLIGAGAVSKTYAKAFSEGLPLKIAAVADVQLEAAEEVAAIVGAQAFDDVETMIAEVLPTVAIVCTPPVTHTDICTELMNMGIHVLCEQPLAVKSHDAHRMINVSKTNDVVFTMGSQFRFAEDVQETQRLLNSGILGDIVLYENTFAGQVDMSQRWNSVPQISGGGVLIDRGTHSVDIMRFLLGSIIDLQVVEGRRTQMPDVEDTVRLFLRSESGAAGSINLSWSINNVKSHFISVYGSEGTLLVGWNESKYRRNDGDWTVFGNGYDEVAAFRSQILNFVEAVDSGQDLLVSPEDALASVMAIETAYEALRTQQWRPVTERQEPWSRPSTTNYVSP
ncbi:MAG: Gfo/Idh/MocA family oxidoreductase [Fuerstiella sp.]|jgi:predicted dehydrogenase|nr:Gfo/Idh/MocA family oxidoreductase [Fuerstiella sp.]MDG2128857.1 Gfo/Idh/MocA family oxidoreductase [Fuerstiella sp.]